MKLLRRLLTWLRTPNPDVSAAWLRDNTRRECGVGVEQSCSQWPWDTQDGIAAKREAS